ncbi:hypothetical protein [Isoptericola sp. NPDC056573]|uniref:hypothetical protein n=1 Tax=unclassified Isoptericola TaxID=2623355 RepID=UPI0036B392A2
MIATVAAVVLTVMLLTALIVALVGLVRRFAAQHPADDGGEAARAARRHEATMSAIALGAAAVTALTLVTLPVTWPDRASAPGLAQTLAPFAVALVFCAVRAVGERTWPRPAGEVRTAPLGRRSVRSLGGARLVAVLATAGAVVAALVATGLTADPTGRAFSTGPVALPDGGTIAGSSGPYPGWAYGVPMLLGLAVALGATLVALTAIVRRPPLHGVPARHDDAVRATSAARLLGAVQVCLGLALGGTLMLAGSAVQSQGHHLLLDDVPTQGLVSIGAVVGFSGVAIALASLVAGLFAASARPASPTAPSTPPPSEAAPTAPATA